MSITAFQPQHYASLLKEKTQRLTALLAPFYTDNLEVFSSPTTAFRMRAEFRFWHEGDDGYYVMFANDDVKSTIKITHFAIAHQRIQQLMQTLREQILVTPILKEKLYQVEFLAGLSGDSLITLVYHKALSDEWLAAAKQLEQQLTTHIVGRSHKQKLVCSKDYIIESLTVNNTVFNYTQVEASFTQPNAYINQQMLTWATTRLQQYPQRDLLELYCGNGNFTIPLSLHVNRVLATEISKTSVASAQANCQLNQRTNIAIARLSSEEFSAAYHHQREFQRLKEANIILADYDFSTVLVDPPRAGLDINTLTLLAEFQHILYISCNPLTLMENLNVLTKTHKIVHAALFDQFPYTSHIETGVYLIKLA